MRSAIQARDDVLGVVAHDLRNPLNSIVLHTALLVRKRGPRPALGQADVEAQRAGRAHGPLRGRSDHVESGA